MGYQLPLGGLSASTGWAINFHWVGYQLPLGGLSASTGWAISYAGWMISYRRVADQLRWVDDKLQVHEEFTNLYQVTNTSAKSLVSAIKDCLLRLNLNSNRCRGQCYDAAGAMARLKSVLLPNSCLKNLKH